MAIRPGERVCFSLLHLSGDVQGLKELNKSLINDELGMTERDGQFYFYHDR